MSADIHLASGGDTTLSAFDASARQMRIDTGGVLRFDAPLSTTRSHSRQADGDDTSVSASGHKLREDSVNYNRLNVGQLNIRAQGGVQVQIGQNDSIQALASQPGMAWLGQLHEQAQGNQVHWQRVQRASERWSYQKDGLGPVAAAIVTVIAAAATAGIGAEMGIFAGDALAVGAGQATVIEGAAFLTPTGLGISGAVGNAVQAGVASIASQAAVSFFNNDGNLAAVFDELGSSQSVRSVLASMLSGGAMANLTSGYSASSYAANVGAGCVFGQLNGNGCGNGAAYSALIGAAAWGYNAATGYNASVGPGTNTSNPFYYADENGRQPIYSWGNNVIGLNDPTNINIGSQGEPVSLLLNQVPFINATAGFHDWLFNARVLPFNIFTNVGTMLPAAIIGAGASLAHRGAAWVLPALTSQPPVKALQQGDVK